MNYTPSISISTLLVLLTITGCNIDSDSEKNQLYPQINNEVVITKNDDDIRHTLPKISKLPDGGYIIVWMSYLYSYVGEEAILLQRFDSDGNKLGKELRINPLDKNGLHPSVIGLNNGGYSVSWQSNDGDHEGIYFQKFNVLSELEGEAILANQFIQGEQVYPSIGHTGDSGTVITWMNNEKDWNDPDWNVYARIFDQNSVPLTNQFKVNPENSYWNVKPQVTSLNSNGFIITWELDRAGGINAQRYDNTGKPLGEPFVIAPSLALKPAISKWHNGGFIVTWGAQSNHDLYEQDIYTQLFNVLNEPISKVIQVNNIHRDNQFAQSISSSENGNFAIVWISSSNQEIDKNAYIQCFDSSGKKMEDEKKINNYSKVNLNSFYVNYTSRPQLSIMNLRLDTYIVTWSDYNNIYTNTIKC